MRYLGCGHVVRGEGCGTQGWIGGWGSGWCRWTGGVCLEDTILLHKLNIDLRLNDFNYVFLSLHLCYYYIIIIDKYI